jgi:hypothetical protein
MSAANSFWYSPCVNNHTQTTYSIYTSAASKCLRFCGIASNSYSRKRAAQRVTPRHVLDCLCIAGCAISIRAAEWCNCAAVVCFLGILRKAVLHTTCVQLAQLTVYCVRKPSAKCVGVACRSTHASKLHPKQRWFEETPSGL